MCSSPSQTVSKNQVSDSLRKAMSAENKCHGYSPEDERKPLEEMNDAVHKGVTGSLFSTGTQRIVRNVSDAHLKLFKLIQLRSSNRTDDEYMCCMKFMAQKLGAIRWCHSRP